MRALAMIPARGGSRGVHRKNIRIVGGKPLLVWSVEAAQAAKFVEMVVVSSDDAEILETARRAGAIAQERPDHLATDTATLDFVARHVLRNMAGYKPEIIVTLQPTCPVRRPGLIDDCIQRLCDTDVDSLFTACAITNCWHREGNAEWAEDAVWVSNNPLMLQRQQIPANALHWAKDGSVVVTRAYMLDRDDGSSRPPRLIGGRALPFQNEKTVDIDSEADLAAASALLYAREEQIA